MKEYNRLTHNAENLEFCSPCYLCKHKEERPVRNKNKCSMEECDYLKCYEALSDLEDTIENAAKIHSTKAIAVLIVTVHFHATFLYQGFKALTILVITVDTTTQIRIKFVILIF